MPTMPVVPAELADKPDTQTPHQHIERPHSKEAGQGASVDDKISAVQEPTLRELDPESSSQPAEDDSHAGVIAGFAAGAAALTAGATRLAQKLGGRDAELEEPAISASTTHAADTVGGVSRPGAQETSNSAPDVPMKSPARSSTPETSPDAGVPEFESQDIAHRSSGRQDLSSMPREESTQSIMSQSPPSAKPPQAAAGKTTKGSGTRPALVHSGTQTENDFESSYESVVPNNVAAFSEARPATPGIMLPDLADPSAKALSRAKSLRRQRRKTIRRNEEVVAAAVVIYAAAKELSPSASSRSGSPHVEQNIVEALTEATGMGGVITSGVAGDGGVDLGNVSDPVADLSTDDEGKKSTDGSRGDRHRRHRHHSSRPGDSKSGSHHKSRRDSDVSAKSATSDLFVGPKTPKRTDSGFSVDISRSASSKKQRTPEEQAAHEKRKEERKQRTPKEQAEHDKRKEGRKQRTPEEQAEHDRRKEERHAGREKERGGKGKDPETPQSDRPSHRSSRRYSQHSQSSRSERPSFKDEPSPSNKKFFDLKNVESVVAPNLVARATESAVPRAAKEPPKPDAPKRSHTNRESPRKSVDVAQSKEHKASREHKHRDRSSAEKKLRSPAKPETDVEGDAIPGPSKPAKDAKETKEEKHHRREERLKTREADAKKKQPSGLKSVFKKLFT
ncbi:hypothetical protein BJ170DRAFT_608594 [Xylariales sp. AK1849]|nr:hypothetical protein BJ170DRAFT_608594 [Xylariales sp. AK1849]